MKCTAEQLASIRANPAFRSTGGLPSRSLPYTKNGQPIIDLEPDGTFFIRPFGIAELRLLSTAASVGNMQHAIRAFDLCISVDVQQLSLGDFYYLMLWQRINSFPKRPYAIPWDCDSALFKSKETGQYLLYDMPDDQWPSSEVLETDYEATKCGFSNTSIVQTPDLEIFTLDEDLVLPEGFDFPRVKIMLDLQEALKTPDLAYLAPGIQWIAGETFEEKMEAANADPSLVFEGLDLENAVVHGFGEQVTVKCAQCRVEHTVTLKTNPESFFL